MSLETDIQLLARVSLFADFKPDHLRLLAFGAEARTLGKGTRLFAEGAMSDGGYVIVRGNVELTVEPDNRIIASYGPGALIGEMALLTQTNRPTTAIATEHTEVLKITRQLFRRMLEEYPELAELLHDRIARSTFDFLDRLDRIQVKLDHANAMAEKRQAPQDENIET